ncbi:hypothetical protein OSB04_026188 [Centaurea solstitialis]|uniref:AP2/ERF domain-containing protein n=1 Tax=Centaurea solstitialis TaxID=347529 RepID=A0AA38SUY4_9ASTR|nr:hypothetical protein OSB04_026188 [Centaurea solstitialis]
MASRRRRNSSATAENDGSSGSSSRHPVYHGIRSRSGKWVSEIREPNKSTRIWLGTYPTPEMAATAYDVAALALKGSYAVLNFPDSVLSNTLPECPTADDIRAAAAAAAAARAPAPYGGNAGGHVLVEEQVTAPCQEFVDDEAMFDMPNLLSDMAEGMLMSPPRINYSPPEDDTYNYYYSGGGNLWNY